MDEDTEVIKITLATDDDSDEDDADDEAAERRERRPTLTLRFSPSKCFATKTSAPTTMRNCSRLSN